MNLNFHIKILIGENVATCFVCILAWTVYNAYLKHVFVFSKSDCVPVFMQEKQ